MTHCGNRYGHEDDSILSLREKIELEDDSFVGNNEDMYEAGTYYRPHATFILNDGLLGEMKGVKNNKPGKKLHKYIIPLLKDPRIEGVGDGGYEPQHNFDIRDLPEGTAEELLKSKPLLGGIEYYIKNVGIDDTVTNIMTIKYYWEFDDQNHAIVDKYKDIEEFSSFIGGDFEKQVQFLEDGESSIYIDQGDPDWVLETFKTKHPEEYAESIKDPEFKDADNEDIDSVFKDVYSVELESAYYDASQVDFESKAWKDIRDYVSTDKNDPSEGGFYLDQPNGMWDKFSLKVDLEKADLAELENDYQYDLAQYVKDKLPTYYYTDWSGMDYSKENEDVAMERFRDLLAER